MRFLLAIALSILLAACQWSSPRPDLRRLYAFQARPDDRVPPVIVIPGILGSRLRNRHTHQDVWPPLTIWSLLFDEQKQLALKFDPASLAVLPDDVEAYDLFEGALGLDFYGEILRTLADSGGYVRSQPGTPQDPRIKHYYVFPYDWRQDNVVTARKLDALIEQIRRDYRDPTLKVDIVAHSMGGLVTRYFLRYGTDDVLDGGPAQVNLRGAGKLHTVVLLGTPNLGSVTSAYRMQNGWALGLRSITAQTLATLPSIYELFPHPLNDWAIDTKGQSLDLDLFDPSLWREAQWSVFQPEMVASVEQQKGDGPALQHFFEKQLERARHFVWALTVPLPATPVKLVVFGGDCELTPTRMVIEDIDGHRHMRAQPEEIAQRVDGVDYLRRMFEPGDGLVTKTSLLARTELNPTSASSRSIFFPLAYSVFLCENHDRLTGNIAFQDNLLNVLLSHDRPWDQPQNVDSSPMPMTPLQRLPGEPH